LPTGSRLQSTARARHFGWLPFLGFMHGSLEVNIMSFCEKAFLYGSLIWLLGRLGTDLAIMPLGLGAALH
jgi:hypothetical protein